MVALEPITKQFRKVNNLDLVNLVIVHDGDADTSDFVAKSREVSPTDLNKSPF
jgi:predicted ATP-dependent endonuclease of OLD family